MPTANLHEPREDLAKCPAAAGRGKGVLICRRRVCQAMRPGLGPELLTPDPPIRRRPVSVQR
jgi:hypothetical protein